MLVDEAALRRVAEELTCPICLETAQLPVNFLCFRGCGGRYSFGSTCLRSVLCMHCAADALQLGRPPASRFSDSGGFTHCLICRETRVDARVLTPENAFVLNHNVASIMDALAMGATCRSCDLTCESQSDLLQHYLRRCPAAIVRCRFRGCAHWHPRGAAAEHEDTCLVGRGQCGQCGTWMDRTDLLRHMVAKCRLRTVNCVLCSHSALLPDMLEHLRLHQCRLQGQIATPAAPQGHPQAAAAVAQGQLGALDAVQGPQLVQTAQQRSAQRLPPVEQQGLPQPASIGTGSGSVQGGVGVEGRGESGGVASPGAMLMPLGTGLHARTSAANLTAAAAAMLGQRPGAAAWQSVGHAPAGAMIGGAGHRSIIPPVSHALQLHEATSSGARSVTAPRLSTAVGSASAGALNTLSWQPPVGQQPQQQHMQYHLPADQQRQMLGHEWLSGAPRVAGAPGPVAVRPPLQASAAPPAPPQQSQQPPQQGQHQHQLGQQQQQPATATAPIAQSEVQRQTQALMQQLLQLQQQQQQLLRQRGHARAQGQVRAQDLCDAQGAPRPSQGLVSSSQGVTPRGTSAPLSLQQQQAGQLAGPHVPQQPLAFTEAPGMSVRTAAATAASHPARAPDGSAASFPAVTSFSAPNTTFLVDGCASYAPGVAGPEAQSATHTGTTVWSDAARPAAPASTTTGPGGAAAAAAAAGFAPGGALWEMEDRRGRRPAGPGLCSVTGTGMGPSRQLDGHLTSGPGRDRGRSDDGFAAVVQRRGAFWPPELDDTQQAAGRERAGSAAVGRAGNGGVGAEAASMTAAADETARLVRAAAAIVRASAVALERRSLSHRAVLSLSSHATVESLPPEGVAAANGAWWGVAGQGARGTPADRSDLHGKGSTAGRIVPPPSLADGMPPAAVEACRPRGATARVSSPSAMRRSFSDSELMFDVLEELVRASTAPRPEERAIARVSASGM